MPPPTTLVDSLPTLLPSPALTPTLDLPIALRKGIRSTRNRALHYVNLSYHRLSPMHFACLSALSSVSIPKLQVKLFLILGGDRLWLKKCVFYNSGTWDVSWFLQLKLVVTRLVAKCYTHVSGLDYGDTFFQVSKMTSVRLFLSMAAIRH